MRGLCAFRPCLGILLSITISPTAAAQEAKDQEPRETAEGRMGSSRFQHLGPISRILYSPDGKTIISGGADRMVRIWNARTGEQIRTIDTGGRVLSLSMTSDGTRIAATGFGLSFALALEGSAIRIWETATGEIAKKISIGQTFATSAALSRDGSTLFAYVFGMNNPSIKVFDVNTGEERGSIEAGQVMFSLALDVSPDGKMIAMAGAQGPARIWDVATRKEICQLEGQAQGILNTVAFSPDGTTLASLVGKGCPGLWDATTGKLRRRLEGDDEAFMSLAFSPDGKILAAAAMDMSLRLWDTESGETLLKIQRGPRQVKMGMMSVFFLPRGLAFSPDGKVIAASGQDHAIHLWDVSSGKEVFPHEGHTAHVASLALSPEGRTLASAGGDGTVRLWDVATRKEKAVIRHHGAPVRAVAFSPDGKTLASGGEDDLLILTDPATGKKIASWELDLLDGEQDAGAGMGVPIMTTPRHIQTVAYSPDGARIVVSSSDSSAILVDPKTGEQRVLFQSSVVEGDPIVSSDSEQEEAPVMLTVFPGGGPWGETAAFSIDGETLAFRSGDRGVMVCDGETGKERTTIRYGPRLERNPLDIGPSGDAITSIAISPDGGLLATGHADGKVRTSEIATGAKVASWEIETERDRGLVSCVAFSPCGSLLATADAGGVVAVWDVGVGKRIASKRWHDEGVMSVAFSPDGRIVASGGLDSFVNLWDISALSRSLDGWPRKLAPAELDRLWDVLAGKDAKGAQDAIWSLAACPGTAVPMLKERVRPVRYEDAEEAEGWVADLDHDEFARREAAAEALSRIGLSAEPALRKAVDGDPSPEVRLRVTKLLDALRPPFEETPSEPLRTLRAMRVLEQIGTPEARRVLESIAEGSDSEWERTRVRRAVERLALRPPPPRTYRTY